jgi:AcrR family transcriptional regulator
MIVSMVESSSRRRTQAERSATTRAAILDATVASLVEGGYSGTTTTEVARRAGVSAGALLHHFPSKIDLLYAAVGRLFDDRNAEYREAMATLPRGEGRLDAAIDVLWQMFAGPTFVAWTELWVAARTDPELAGSVTRLDKEFMAASEAVVVELFADEVEADPNLLRLGLALVFTFLDGLALCQLVPGYRPVATDELLATFKFLLRTQAPFSDERSGR